MIETELWREQMRHRRYSSKQIEEEVKLSATNRYGSIQKQREEASDRDSENYLEAGGRNVPPSQINHLVAKNANTMQAQIALSEQVPKK